MNRVLLISLTILLFAIYPVSAVSAPVQPSTWAVGEVSTAIDLGLVPKYLQNEYTQPITRAEFVSLIMQLPRIRDMALEELETGNAVYFSDTENEDIIRCAALGIVEGDGKGHFMPDDRLTRQQAAVILYKACTVFAPWVINEDTLITTLFRGYASYDMPHNWTDGANIRSYARSHINWCYRHNIMAGVGNNAFDADGNYTREQAIITVLRLYYADGQAALNKLQNGPDYYPIFTDYAMQSISGWIDSSLAGHTKEEIGIVNIETGETWADKMPEYVTGNNHIFDLGGGVYAVQNTDTQISVFDAFGDTVSTVATIDPVILTGSANGLLCVLRENTTQYVYYTQTGKQLPPF